MTNTNAMQQQISQKVMVQRMPSFRKHRLDSSQLNSSEDTRQKRFMAQVSAEAQMVQIKSRHSLASATVDSRRNSNKKKKDNQSSRKVTQNNFHTIPVKENSYLPTPQDSTYKPIAKEPFSSSKMLSNLTSAVTNLTNQQSAASSQRQLRFAGMLPTQKQQISQGNSTSRYSGPTWKREDKTEKDNSG